MQSPIYPHDLHCVPRRVTTSSDRGHVDESATELSLFRTTCMEQADDKPETAEVDRIVSQETENNEAASTYVDAAYC